MERLRRWTMNGRVGQEGVGNRGRVVGRDVLSSLDWRATVGSLTKIETECVEAGRGRERGQGIEEGTMMMLVEGRPSARGKEADVLGQPGLVLVRHYTHSVTILDDGTIDNDQERDLRAKRGEIRSS
jgi:hypothetical protein